MLSSSQAPSLLLLFLPFFLLLIDPGERGRGGREERERERRREKEREGERKKTDFVVPLIYALIGYF